MLKTYNIFLIKEFADNVIESNIIQQSLSINQSTFTIKVKERIYVVMISLFGGQESAIIKVDFMLKIENKSYPDSLSDIKTNDGDALLVMANIVAIIKHWLKSDMEQSFSGQLVDFKDITVVGLWINSKSEIIGDMRRSNIYNYYIYKNLEKLGINIIEKKNITDVADKSLVDGHVMFQYKIEPSTIEKIRNLWK